MKSSLRLIALMLISLFAVSAMAQVGSHRMVRVEQVIVPAGMPVNLVFDQAVDSQYAQVGDNIRLHVANNVVVNNKVIVTAGTRVTGVVSQVSHRKRYGVNAKIMIVLNPVRTTFNQRLPIEPRSEGKYVQGKKSRQAAGATIGGAIVAGPVGMVGGYFVHGKRVQIHVGDPLATQVSQTTTLTRRIK